MRAAPPRGQLTEKSKLTVKVYVVCLRRNLFREGEPNIQLLAARLTRAAAQEIVDRTPGTFIEKLVADKSGRR